MPKPTLKSLQERQFFRIKADMSEEEKTVAREDRAKALRLQLKHYPKSLGPGEQLPMFMRAGDIKQQYRPLPGDFQDNEEGETETKRQFWQRKADEASMSKAAYDAANEGMSVRDLKPPELDVDKLGERSDYPYQRTGESTGSWEKREQPWWEERAASNAARFNQYLDAPSLKQSIAKEGVQSPVHLGTTKRGKKTVIGGHHRIAAANEVNPDMLVPVLHHEGDTPWDAGKPRGQLINGRYITTQINTGYPYT